jgi:monofunctional glycosyltransferase
MNHPEDPQPPDTTPRVPASTRRPRARRFVRVAAWIVSVGLTVSVAPVIALRWIDPPTSAFMLERRVEGLANPARRVPVDYEWKDWESVSPNARLAMVAAEDQKFLEHEGFDFESIEKAVELNKRSRRTRGASTISQQVAKNLFLWPGKNYLRKGLEAGYTILIEALWPKRRILEVYLNIAEFGDGTYGVEAASRRFFHKSSSRLTRYEGALLAAVLPNPKRMRADRPSHYVERRAWWIERQMMRLGYHHLDEL